MPASRKRGGTKKHNKRVSARNTEIKSQRLKAQKYQKEQFEMMLKEYEKQMKSREENSKINQIEGIDSPEI